MRRGSRRSGGSAVRPLAALLTGAALLVGCGRADELGEPPPTSSAASTDHACSASVSIDRFSDALNKTRFQGAYVGNLSGLAVDSDGAILALSDRSVLFTLDPGTLRPVRAQPLADEAGERLDSEAVVVDRDGSRLISSETEPSVRRYTRDGRIVDRLPVPVALRVAPVGRASRNLTFEGLALAPDGHTLFASMEAALIGDQGNLVRWQTWTRARPPDSTEPGGERSAAAADEFRPGAQYAYRVDPALGVSELAPTGDGRLLVLERGYLPGVGNTIRLYLADPAGASDVSGVAELPGPPGLRWVAKTLLADLGRCPSLGATAKEAQPNPLLDNIEGMTVTSRDPAGGLRLLLVSDDNESSSQATRLYILTAHLPAP